MPYFVNEACVDELDLSCVEECPVDCIYEGGSKMYINPKECIDCGACEPVCPVDAIAYDDTAKDLTHKEDNARFFYEPLEGRTEPLGNPGGARKIGKIEADTALIAQV
jgi:NAD-dependent dihydropyrimidine dehydrogenase PreA subunit